MDKYYAKCDCGYTGRHRDCDFSALEDARLHILKAHGAPGGKIFTTDQADE